MMNRRKDRNNVKTITHEPNETWIWLGLTAIYLLLVTWGLLSEGTWDDDCVGRFFNVSRALTYPRELISLWNRPLFTLLYVLPLELGKLAIVFETALISILTCYFTYRAAKISKLPNAFMVIPLLAFQAFYFPVSFSALTEPLGALVLALGLFFLVQKRYLLFALAGSLLPLARLELSPLLLLWAVVLVKERKFTYIFMLGVPTLLWNFAGMLVDGDPLWLLHKVFTGKPNIYGHGSFWQYFHRYIFFTGPVIFYFFMLGLFERLYQRKFDFLLIQFVTGFMIYVLFSWKLSVGQATGFMRNLLPLAPYAALLALEGYNSWVIKDEDHQKGARILAYSGVVILLTALFFSRTLVLHHIVTEQSEYVKLGLILALAGLYLARTYLLPVRATAQRGLMLLAMVVGGSSGAYTLITEPPIGLTPERATMGQVAGWYKENNLHNTVTYANHVWFFYSGELDFYGDSFGRVTMANLGAAPKNSIVIWENHYSHRLQGDVQLDYFKDNPNFKVLGQMRAPGTQFVVFVFQKI